EFEALARTMAKAGYRPANFRPFENKGVLLTAALWLRDGLPFRVHFNLTLEELIKVDAELTKEGFIAADIAGYLVEATTRFAILWVPETPIVSEFRICVDNDRMRIQSASHSLQEQGFVPRTQSSLEMGDRFFHASIWWKLEEPLDEPGFSCDQTEVAFEKNVS